MIEVGNSCFDGSDISWDYSGDDYDCPDGTEVHWKSVGYGDHIDEYPYLEITDCSEFASDEEIMSVTSGHFNPYVDSIEEEDDPNDDAFKLIMIDIEV